jgi:RimJ/RimL family protein N-acetyltransferase
VKQVHFDDEWHGQILSRNLDENRPFMKGYDRSISITRDGKLLGGILYDNYRVRSIQMHMVVLQPDWGFRDVLQVIFDYPFNQLGVERIFAMVPSTSAEILRFDRALGFKDHTRIEGAIPGGDLVVLSMDRDHCRWLKLKPRFERVH